MSDAEDDSEVMKVEDMSAKANEDLARLCGSERAKSRAFINWLSIFIRTTLKTSDGTEPASPWKVSFSRRGEMSMSAMPPAAERESICVERWPASSTGISS